MTPKLYMALKLAERGLYLFPLRANSKLPLHKGWPQEATLDPDQLRKWFDNSRDYNIGVATGPSGLIVADPDRKHVGIDGVANFIRIAGGIEPDTFMVGTPTDGQHVYFRGSPVKSSVGELAPGVDIKSKGGYVVGPGSTIDGKPYWVINPSPIADAPEWFIATIAEAYTAKAEPRQAPEGITVDAPIEIDRARRFLTDEAPPAIEGSGGDTRTITTAVRLHDWAISEETAFDLMAEHYNPRCAPEWELAELRAKVASAYKSAQNAFGCDTGEARVAEFDVLTDEDIAKIGEPANDNDTGGPEAVNPFLAGRLRYDDYKLDLSPDYLVKGLLDQGALSVMYGAPKSGKTFAALDLAHHIARGETWRGRRVKKASVIYLSMEGGKKLLNRVEVLKQRHPGSLPNFEIWPRPADFRDPKTVRQLIEYQHVVAKENPEMPRLIVVDTVARAMAGADENSAKDMGAFVRAVDKVREATGAHVLLIHHSGKDEARGMRGSSALLGAIDHELHVQYDAETGVRTIKSGVQRDLGQSNEGFSFKLASHGIGTDADGDAVTSCYCDPCDAPAKSKGEKLSRAETVVLDVLQELGPAPVKRDDWKAASVNRDDLCVSDKPNLRKDTFNRAVRDLTAKRLIRKEGDELYLVENGEAFADEWPEAA